MSTAKPTILVRLEYEEAAQAYLRSLPPEHFMEATAQATQRKITLESLDLVHARQPDVQVFNELLVQYPLPRRQKPHQVVPDNMVVVWPEPIQADGSYDLPLQPTRPLWVLEYVSPSNKRKDYEDSFRKYERHLKVPYYLLFYPDNQELTLYHHNGKRYVSVKPNADGRYAIPELDLELALLDGWVRFWYQGELLPLPADLQRALDEARRQLRVTRQELGVTRQELGVTRQELQEATRRANNAEEELARLRSELEQLRGRPGSGPRG
jgi:Uma2 family endonuclease